MNSLKKNTYLLLTLCASGVFFSSSAQSLREMTEFSTFQNLGSARYMGTGGAFSSLGNDYSALHLNPAGIGMFRKDEIGLNLGILNQEYNQTLGSQSQMMDESGLILNNFGLIRVINNSRDKGSQFSITFNQIANFRSESRYNGNMQNRSFAEQLLDSYFGADLNTVDDYGYYLYEYGILEDESGDGFIDSHNAQGTDIGSSEEKTTSGSMNEFALTYGGHVRNKWYYGISMGITILNYQEHNVYQEDNFDPGSFLETMTFDETYTLNGIGFNLKGGVIYRPISPLRIGMSFQTPTIQFNNGSFSDEYRSSVRNPDPNNNQIIQLQPIEFFNPQLSHTLYTPLRLGTGVSYVLGRRGFLSLDYDFMDMRMARYSSRQFDLSLLNDDAGDFLTVMHQLRIGTELRFNRFFLRGGYSISTSPYSDEFNFGTNNGVHLGMGLRTQGYDFNISYAYFQRTGDYYPHSYALPVQQQVVRSIFQFGIVIYQ